MEKITVKHLVPVVICSHHHAHEENLMYSLCVKAPSFALST